jgi:hypothetical protein
MSFRLFIFERDGTMRRIPQRIANDLPSGQQRLPEYAGQSIRYALVWLRVENRRPIGITCIEAGYYRLDGTGKAQAALAEAAMSAWETHDGEKAERIKNGNVIGISARLARKKWERDNRWAPTEDEISKIKSAIWSKGIPQGNPDPPNAS